MADAATVERPPFDRFTRINPKILRPRLPCIGHIKLGGKGREMKGKGGSWRMPVKYDHFVLTKRSRDTQTENFIRDAELHRAIGDQKPTAIDVRLMFNEPAENFQASFLAYEGRKRRCQGNGSMAYDYALKRDIRCTCPLLKQHVGDYDGPHRPAGVQCKPYGVLSVLIDQAKSYGGFHAFRTTSWETISSLTAALDRFHQDFGGLAFIPFQLVTYPSTDTYTDTKGEEHSSTSNKVALVLRGTVETAYQIARGAAEQRAQALQLSSGEVTYTAADHAEQLRDIATEDDPHVADEFYEAEDAEFVEVDDAATDEEAQREDDAEQVCRWTFAAMDWEQTKINRQIAQYTGRCTELLAKLEAEVPEFVTKAREIAAPDEETGRVIPESAEGEPTPQHASAGDSAAPSNGPGQEDLFHG